MHFATPSYRTVKNRAVAAEVPGILICERQRLRKPNRLPSYIKPEIFATALIEVVALDKAGKHAFELTAAGIELSLRSGWFALTAMRCAPKGAVREYRLR